MWAIRNVDDQTVAMAVSPSTGEVAYYASCENDLTRVLDRLVLKPMEIGEQNVDF